MLRTVVVLTAGHDGTTCLCTWGWHGGHEGCASGQGKEDSTEVLHFERLDKKICY